MIHISQHTENPTTLHVHLEGMLDGEHVPALGEVLREAAARRISRFVFHCMGLTGVDDAGARFLTALDIRDVLFLDLPLTVAWKLDLQQSQTLRTA